MKNLIHLIALLSAVAFTLIGCDNNEVQFAPKATPTTTGTPGPIQPVDPPGGSVTPVDPPKKGNFVVEGFTQKATDKKVDILVIVDNSGSMAEDQRKLGRKIGSFMGQLKDVDWQLGITTTDVSNGQYGLHGELLDFDRLGKSILNKNDPNFEKHFLDTVVRSESDCSYSDCASADEQPLLAAMLAMDKRDDENAGLFRDGADLALIVLTDEDEHSTGGSQYTQSEDVTQFFEDSFNKGSAEKKKLTTYGIAVVPGDHYCLDQQNSEFATHLDQLVKDTNGIMGSICEDNYSQTLSRIGNNVRKLLNNIELKQIPDPKSVEITITPEDKKVRWNLMGKQIHFTKPPKVDSKIVVKYKVLEEETDDDDESDD